MINTIEKQGLRNILLVGILFYPLFIILDFIVYPDFAAALLKIRLCVIAWFAIIYVLTYYWKGKNLFPLIFPSVFIAAFGISLMCFITKTGFASIYYAGNFLVLLTASIFFRIKLLPFSFLLFSILAQHFIMLSFLPFTLTDLMKNIFFLGGFVLISIIMHKKIYELSAENTLLKGFLPICAKCKKIRDDKGYWNQIEKYITDHSGAEFSHGLCSDCAQELYNTAVSTITGKSGGPSLPPDNGGTPGH